jgi:hypothetical protein
MYLQKSPPYHSCKVVTTISVSACNQLSVLNNPTYFVLYRMYPPLPPCSTILEIMYNIGIYGECM